LEVCGAADYQQKLGAELRELGDSEMWRAGKATRGLRPTEAARDITGETKGVGGRAVN
jgi:ketol-acid reductoisomerase